MSDLRPLCAELEAWYPAALALTAIPDTDASAVHGQPGSRFPGNSQAFDAWTTIAAGSRELEANLRYRVTGSVLERGGSDGNTLAAIRAVANLAEAAPPGMTEEAERFAVRSVTSVMTLPAVDLAETAIRLRDVTCPACGLKMVLAWMRSGRVGCGSCRLKGQMVPGRFSDAYVAWDDGTTT